jgi:hypothetical protein
MASNLAKVIRTIVRSLASEPDWNLRLGLQRFFANTSIPVGERNYTGGRPRITQALIPPKPKELLIT